MFLSTSQVSERVVTKNGNGERSGTPLRSATIKRLRDAGFGTAWSYGDTSLRIIGLTNGAIPHHSRRDGETIMKFPGIIANVYRLQRIIPASFPSRPAWRNMPE